MKSSSYLKSILVSLFISWGFLISPIVSAGTEYSVTGVSPGDVLSMRKYPGVKSKIIAQLPPEGSGITTTGKEVKKGRSTWAQVKWGTQTGWVNKRYIKPSAKSASTSANQADAHTHPKNKCTNSITHNHPNGNKSHEHRYSCQQAVDNTDPNAHTHPRNKCTNSVTHIHPNGKRDHTHSYSCQQNSKTADPNAHTHPKKTCTNSITHSHPNGKRTHEHRYNCKN